MVGKLAGVRVLLWLICAAVTALSVQHLPTRVAVGPLLLVCGALLWASQRLPVAVLRRCALVAAAVLGIAGLVLAPRGLAEVPVLVAAAYLPTVLPQRATTPGTVVLAVAFGGAIAWIGQTPVGLLAGLGVPLVAQRTVERMELRSERDRAVAAGRGSPGEPGCAGAGRGVVRTRPDRT